jgi:hypothetical protein
MDQQDVLNSSASGWTQRKRKRAQFPSDAEFEPLKARTLSSSNFPELGVRKNLLLPAPKLLPNSGNNYRKPEQLERDANNGSIAVSDSLSRCSPWDKGHQERSSTFFDMTDMQPDLSFEPAAQFGSRCKDIATTNNVPIGTESDTSAPNDISTSDCYNRDVQHSHQQSSFSEQGDVSTNQGAFITKPIPPQLEPVGTGLESLTRDSGINYALSLSEDPIIEPSDSRKGKVEMHESCAEAMELDADPGASPAYDTCFGMVV